MSIRSRSKVTAVWKEGTDVIELEARGYKAKIYEPVTHESETVPGVNALEYFLGSLAACITTIMHWHASKSGLQRLMRLL